MQSIHFSLHVYLKLSAFLYQNILHPIQSLSVICEAVLLYSNSLSVNIPGHFSQSKYRQVHIINLKVAFFIQLDDVIK